MCLNPFASADWTDESLQKTWEIVRDIAVNDFKLEFYEPYFEVCTFEEMLHIYTTGFPVMFNHWTFGKDYEQLYQSYKNHRTSIAYEVIFNTSPALCYLLENNTSVMQALVMAHAAIGHSAFFKMNSFTRENTNARTILPFLKRMRDYVKEMEIKYGEQRVEEILDVCKTLHNYAIDKSEKKVISSEARQKRDLNRAIAKEQDFDLLVEELGPEVEPKELSSNGGQREENILKFIAKYSPSLKQWERELINMYCRVEQYFYPQRLTKMMNEGFASFWHYQIMHRLHEKGYLDAGHMLEFLNSHTNVLCQRDHDERGYSGLNPYKMGYEIFNEIKRVCENPTEEDKQFFPGLIGKNWVDEVNYAASNFRDPSFILQYLSPKLVRDFKLFKIEDDSMEDMYLVKATQNDEDFKEIRKSLEEQYNYYNNVPIIYVEGASLKGNRTLFLVVEEEKPQEVEMKSLHGTILQMKKLWNYPIKIKYIANDGEKATVTL